MRVTVVAEIDGETLAQVIKEIETDVLLEELEHRGRRSRGDSDPTLRQIFEAMGRGVDMTEELRRYAWDVFGINALPARGA